MLTLLKFISKYCTTNHTITAYDASVATVKYSSEVKRVFFNLAPLYYYITVFIYLTNIGWYFSSPLHRACGRSVGWSTLIGSASRTEVKSHTSHEKMTPQFLNIILYFFTLSCDEKVMLSPGVSSPHDTSSNEVL
jgi:hypothetical protein